MNRSLYAMLHVFDERTRADNTNIDSEKNKTVMSRHLIYLFLSFDVFIIPNKGAFVKPLFYFFLQFFSNLNNYDFLRQDFNVLNARFVDFLVCASPPKLI